MSWHLMGAAEVAKLLGVSKERVRQLMDAYADFPRPEAELTAGRIWSTEAIEGWIAAHPERTRGDQQQVGLIGRFNEPASAAIVGAQVEARALYHDHIGTEHLLLGLRAEGDAVAAAALDVPLGRLREVVREIAGLGDEPSPQWIPFTSHAKRSFELALREARHLGLERAGPAHVLLGILQEGAGAAMRVLEALDLDVNRLRNDVLRLMHGGTIEPDPSVIRILRDVVERLEAIERRLAGLGQ